MKFGGRFYLMDNTYKFVVPAAQVSVKKQKTIWLGLKGQIKE
jgi:hypothetical protein